VVDNLILSTNSVANYGFWLDGMKKSDENKNILCCFSHRPIRSRVAILLFIVFQCKKAVSKNKVMFLLMFSFLKSKRLKNRPLLHVKTKRAIWRTILFFFSFSFYFIFYFSFAFPFSFSFSLTFLHCVLPLFLPESAASWSRVRMALSARQRSFSSVVAALSQTPPSLLLLLLLLCCWS
jgi:hypothetical protein